MKWKIILVSLVASLTIQTMESQENSRLLIAGSTHDRIMGEQKSELYLTDPEYMEIMDNFIFGDVYNLNDVLTDRLRELIALVVLTANQDKCGLAAHTKAALNIGVTPVEIKEAVYQCSPYMGMSKVTSALETINTVFSENNIELPLCRQSTVTENTRYAKGLDIQVKFFGNGMRNAHANTPDGQKHISDYLSAMCFGDFYTRNGLDLKDRELLTFCMLSAMGGCEPQVKAHVTGNLNAGNNKETLIAAVTQALPYIGYPRTLNAIACINEICK